MATIDFTSAVPECGSPNVAYLGSVGSFCWSSRARLINGVDEHERDAPCESGDRIGGPLPDRAGFQELSFQAGDRLDTRDCSGCHAALLDRPFRALHAGSPL